MIVTRSQVNAGAFTDNDEVVAFAPMPEGAKLLNVHGELHVIGREQQSTRLFTGYGFGGELVPDPMDDDAALSLETLWDRYVTKTVVATEAHSTTMLDWDWNTSDGEPFLEPGEMDINDVLGLGMATKKIFDPRLEILSFAKGGPQAHAIVGDHTADDTYTPRDFKTFNSNNRLVADENSWAMLAVAAPNFERRQTVKNNFGSTGARDWAILSNLRNVLGDFWKINVGMIESGAESPYDIVSSAIQELVTPLMIDNDIDNSTMFQDLSWIYVCKSQWTIDYPSDSIPNKIDAQF